MTRPIKKARVTRRRKYYGGGKRRGGTTLKKVGGGNKTRQIKRCRGSKKGGGTKRKVGGRVKSFVKKQGGGPGVDPEQGNHADADALAVVGQRAMLQERPRLSPRRGRRGGPEIFESYLRLPVNSIIDKKNDAKMIAELLGLRKDNTGPEARKVLKKIITPFSKRDELKSPIKLLWPIIRSRVANFDATKDQTFNDFIITFLKDFMEDSTIKGPLEALAKWGLSKKVDGKLSLKEDNTPREEIVFNNESALTHYNLDKIFFVCFWEFEKVKKDNKQFVSLIEKAPAIINSRIDFFKSLLSDEFGHLYTIQEDDFFSHLNPTSVEVMPGDSPGDSSGLYGTINISDKKELGFIRQIKEVEKIEKNCVCADGEDKFITTNIKGEEEVKASNTFQMVSNLEDYRRQVNFKDGDEKKWNEEMDELISSFNKDKFNAFKKKVDGPGAGVTKDQSIYKLSDGVTIYYDTKKFELNKNLSKCGNNKNKDPYVLAAFSTKKTDTTKNPDPDFYVLTTHLESGRNSVDNERKRITGLNEILEEFENLINNKELPLNIPLIIGMDANTPVYKYFYDNDDYDYYKAGEEGFWKDDILLDSLEFKKDSNNKKWLVSGDNPEDDPRETVLKLLDGTPEWLVSKPKNGDVAIEPTTDTTDTVISVNKNRGFGTAQGWKMAADEYHLIDWLCIVNNNLSNGTRKITTTKLAILPTRKKGMTNDLENMLPTGYNDGSLSPEIEPSNIIENIQNGCFGENNHYYSWFSDHLPLVAGLECNGTSFNIVQNNVLSLWLGFDGFKGPNRPSDAQTPAQASVKPATDPAAEEPDQAASEESASEEPAEPAT